MLKISDSIEGNNHHFNCPLHTQDWRLEKVFMTSQSHVTSSRHFSTWSHAIEGKPFWHAPPHTRLKTWESLRDVTEPRVVAVVMVFPYLIYYIFLYGVTFPKHGWTPHSLYIARNIANHNYQTLFFYLPNFSGFCKVLQRNLFYILSSLVTVQDIFIETLSVLSGAFFVSSLARICSFWGKLFPR